MLLKMSMVKIKGEFFFQERLTGLSSREKEDLRIRRADHPLNRT